MDSLQRYDLRALLLTFPLFFWLYLILLPSFLSFCVLSLCNNPYLLQESEYLFNGDLVDRGQNGAEVLFTVLAFKCLFPKQIRVNRGNHECRQQNRIMGFEEEILTKYPGPNGRVLLAACQKVFDCMPLCGLIHNKIFVVHGGLFSQEGVLLDHIRGISRKR